MKLIRFILSHAILLAFLVALGSGYYYRDRLFSADINAQIDRAVHKAMVLVRLAPQGSEPAARPVQEITEQSDLARVEEATGIETASEGTGPIAESEAGPSTPDVTVNDETEQVQPTAQSDEPEAGQSGEDTSQPESGQVEEPRVPDSITAEPEETVSETAEQVASVTKEAAVAEPDKTEPAAEEQAATVSTDREAVAGSHAELINQARLAFKNGDGDRAVILYQQLSELNPDDPNAYGELGNVYYAQGKWQLAGQAYYEAASRLLQHDQHGQVQYLYRVIQGLDKESAEKLRAQLGKQE